MNFVKIKKNDLDELKTRKKTCKTVETNKCLKCKDESLVFVHEELLDKQTLKDLIKSGKAEIISHEELSKHANIATDKSQL
jgi:hypothetical protein